MSLRTFNLGVIAGGGGGGGVTITVAPVLTWTVAHGSSPTITPTTYTGDPATITYDLIRLPSTTVLSGVDLATAQAYVSDRATDIGYEWRVDATATNGAGSDSASSNTVEWYPDVWSPRNLYDARTVTLMGSDVEEWNELMGGRNLVEADPARRPAYSASGFNGGSEPYVEGEGLERLMRTSGFWSATPPFPTVSAYTVLLVWSQQSHVHNRTILVTSGTTRLVQQGGPPYYTQLQNGSSAVDGAETPTTMAIECNGDSVDSYNMQLYYNGVLQGTTEMYPPIASGPGASGNTFSIHSGGRSAMIVALERLLTTNERADFAAYCSVRWGL